MSRLVTCLSALILVLVAARHAAAAHTSDPVAPGATGGSDTGVSNTGEPIVDKQQLFADLDSMTEGTQVWLHDVRIVQKSGNVLKIGDRGHELFVVPVDPSSLDFLTVGAHVDVRGTLRRTPSAGQARLIYAMSSAAARRFARDRFFVATASVVAES
jgi:hypothetical protein